MSERNSYLDQVVANQERLESSLRAKRSAPAPYAPAASAPMAQPADGSAAPPPAAFGGVAPVAAMPREGGSNPVEVRVTGFWRWRTVIVPPNAFVVHTRRGRDEPLHVGLGKSFRFRPATDSYLVVPGAMQTILISAFCICKELQGLLVQAYVQWIIQDFAVAYRKLDFSDVDDPMRLVNLQLKEQAEAAIKDQVATMSIHDVLAEKQPIIEELTARLRSVAEGEGGSDTGLGLRIVTVQIKEAVVSSSRLWENLQKPYRSEQTRLARLAELTAEDAISAREMEADQQRESRAIETGRELAQLRAEAEAAAFDRQEAEKVRRAEQDETNKRALAELADETRKHALELERERAEQETEIARLRLEREQLLARLAQEGELALARAETDAEHTRALLELDRVRLRAEIDNEQSPASIQARMIDALPEVVEKLPKPKELRTVSIGGADGAVTLPAVIAELTAVLEALRHPR